MVVLKVDFCSHEAAKFACEHWHYSRCVPVGKTVYIGVWENNKFTGCVIFGWGVNRNIGSPYGLEQTEVCELVRVALGCHESTVSRIVSIAIKKIKKQSNGLRLVISYADSGQGHVGGYIKQ